MLAAAENLLARAGDEKTVLANHIRQDGDEHAEASSIIDAFFASNLPDLFRSQYGQPAALNLSNSAIRRHRTGGSPSLVGWHMDINFVLDDQPYLVAWTPLHDAGESRAGLEFCWPKSPMALSDFASAWVGLMRDEQTGVFEQHHLDALFARAGSQTRAPKVPAGSSIVFDQFVLHRTQVLPEATEERISIEFRMADLTRPSKIFSKPKVIGLFAAQQTAGEAGDIAFFRSWEGAVSPIAKEALRELSFSGLNAAKG